MVELLLPEILLTALVFVVFGVDLLLPTSQKRALPFLTLLGLLITMAATVPLLGRQETLFGELLFVDSYAVFFKLLFLCVAFFTVILSMDFVSQQLRYQGEFYAILLSATLGMLLLAAAGELITAYISLELVSFSLYVLVSFAKQNLKSNEGGMKYMLLGAFASALLLYGLSLVYGTTGQTTYGGVAAALQQLQGPNPGLSVGLTLVIAGVGFKVAAVPFHMWAPDAYEGAPLPVTAFLSIASKAAGFALVLRLFVEAFGPALPDWRPVIALLAVATMTVGNLVAIQQHNIKRLLAYSSISQVGYLLVGVASLSTSAEEGTLVVSAVLFHLAGYAVTNLAAFLAVIVVFNATGKDEIPDFAGMAERGPFVALALTVALFSLAGMPFFAGFVTKFYLFTAAANQGLLWLVFLAILNSLISLYYYLMVIKQMYIYQAEDTSRLAVAPAISATLFILVVGVLLIGMYPGPLVSWITAASRTLFS